MIDRTEFQVDSVPAVCVTPSLSVIVMTRYSDVQIAWCFGRRKYGEQCRNSAPVREEVALRVVRLRVLAEIEAGRDGHGEVKVAPAALKLRLQVVDRRSEGVDPVSKDASCGRAGRTAAAPDVPNVAIALPVNHELAVGVHDIDAVAGVLVCRVGVVNVLPGHDNAPLCQCIYGKVEIRKLEGT